MTLGTKALSTMLSKFRFADKKQPPLGKGGTDQTTQAG